MISEQYKLKEWIKFYRGHGLNVAPVLAEYKSPRGLFNWKKYQTQFLRQGEIVLLYHRLNKRDWHIWMHTGQTSRNIGILDIDDKAFARERFGEFFDSTLVCETEHGYHFWFIETDQQGGTQGWGELPIDIRSQGGGVIIPPSPIRSWLGKFDLNKIKTINSIKSLLEDIGIPDNRKKIQRNIQNRTFVVAKKIELEEDHMMLLWDLAGSGFTLKYYLENIYQGDQHPRRKNNFWCTLCNTPEIEDNYALEYHPKTDEFHCYACGRHGGLISMIMYDLGLDEESAIEWIHQKGLYRMNVNSK